MLWLTNHPTYKKISIIISDIILIIYYNNEDFWETLQKCRVFFIAEKWFFIVLSKEIKKTLSKKSLLKSKIQYTEYSQTKKQKSLWL